MSNKTIAIKYMHGSPALEQASHGGCIDLYNYEDVTLKVGEFQLVNLGVAMALPEGYDAIVIPRSSTFKRYGIILVNSPGYIDNSYRGSDDYWFAPVLATRDIYIPKGTRCFQFRLIEQQPSIKFEPVDKLSDTNRGGCGSTGV